MDAYINVKNFGPIEKAEIDLRPLTVFVGESNTGKTYLAALIYALHQQFWGISQFPWVDSVTSYFSLYLPFARPSSTKSTGGVRTRNVRGTRKVKHAWASVQIFRFTSVDTHRIGVQTHRSGRLHKRAQTVFRP